MNAAHKTNTNLLRIIMSNKISVIIPVYNEENAILSTINQLKETLSRYDYELIVVDDGSTDKTSEFLKKVENITLIAHPYNIGYGASLKRGIKEAKNEVIVMLDGDDTYPVSSIPSLLNFIDNYSLVTGARVGKNIKIPHLRKPAKFVLTKLANFLTGRKIPDLNCGLRVIKKSNVLQYFNILPQRFSFTITHLVACLTNGHTVKFVPVTYQKRKGKSTIHPIKDFIRFNTIILRVITYFNPFKIFSLISSILFLLSILIFSYTFFIVGKLMDVTVMVVFLASLQIFLFGLIADLIAKSRLR